MESEKPKSVGKTNRSRKDIDVLEKSNGSWADPNDSSQLGIDVFNLKLSNLKIFRTKLSNKT